MKNPILKYTFLLVSFPALLYGQNVSEPILSEENKTEISGFVRGGLYGSIDRTDDNLYISSLFTDLGLKVENDGGGRFKAFADLRFRYGTEFLEQVNRIDFREAFITITGRKWDLSAGQKIIKWGRADFTNPTSKLSPRNMISRSPDAEDMDLGNLLADLRWSPVSWLSFEAVVIPYYRSSVLLIEPLTLPYYVNIYQIETLITDKKMFSYGFKADVHVKGADLSFSLFDGYDPMPGIALTEFNLDLSGAFPVPYTDLTLTPYRIRNIGADFETSLGSTGLRGEIAWTIPFESWETFEYVPLEEIKWVAGTDRTFGNWRITGEYSGKYIPGFKPATVDPIIGTEPDLVELASLMATPGFDLNEYVRQQVGAFNRLYNYQLNNNYHSAGIRIERDLFYGKLTPSLFSLYNFTSHDFLLMPVVSFKPSDGLTITAGWEYYSGRKGSVYDIADEFMNSVRISLRADF